MKKGGICRPFQDFHRITHLGCTGRLQRIIVDFGAEHSFNESAQRIKEHYGLDLSFSLIRSVTLKHAARAQAFWNSLETLSDTNHRLSASDSIITEMDGSMIPIVDFSVKEEAQGEFGDKRKCRRTEWKELRLCVAQVKGKTTACYSISLDAGPLHAGLEWRKVVELAGCTAQTFVHGVGDGAPWIATEFDRQFGTQGAYLIDFFHVSEYLAQAACSACPAQPDLWRHNQQQLLKAGQIEQVIGNLRSVNDPAEAVIEATNYLTHRICYLNYAAALAADLPIGSGLIESGHRHVIQRRLKIPGAWWKLSTARAMAALRIIRKNNLWSLFWAA